MWSGSASSAGIGFMGMIHTTLAARGLAGARVVAICSRDPRKRAGDWTGDPGQLRAAGAADGPGRASRLTPMFDALLADPAVGLVDLCVPNDEHAPGSPSGALEAGKDVLVEKPIALGAGRGRRHARRGQGQRPGALMVAHVLPFFPEFAFALEAAPGAANTASSWRTHLTRVISKPDWSSGIASSDRSGGPAIDLHIHDTHFVGLLCGVPRAVHSRGVTDGPAVVHLTTQYLYDGPTPAVSAISGRTQPEGAAVRSTASTSTWSGRRAQLRVRRRLGRRPGARLPPGRHPARWDGREARPRPRGPDRGLHPRARVRRGRRRRRPPG